MKKRLKELTPFFEYDSKNRIRVFECESKIDLLCWKNTQKWTFFDKTQNWTFFIWLENDPFVSIWLKELNFVLNMIQRIVFYMTSRIELFLKFDPKNWTFCGDSQTWTFFLNMTQRRTFLFFDSKNWAFFFFDAKNWTSFFFKKYDSTNWTL